MPRRPKQVYRCQSLGALTRQLLRFAPPEKRIEQVFRAEKLHDEIDPDVTYPYEYIAYRITSYRVEHDDATLLVGAAILPDLRLMIDTLSRSVSIPLPPEAEAETVAQLAARLNVSTKTVSRWRDAGLRWRWVQPPDDVPRQLILPRDAVERFLAQHQTRVQRASQFTQLTPAQRKSLIERARRMVRRRPDLTLHRVATHLARRTGRAVETMRQLLEQHDQRRPDHAIFVDHQGPLTTRQQRISARAYRMGVPVDRIAKRFNRSPSTIYRAIHQRRAAALRRLNIRFVAMPIFDHPDADKMILDVDPNATPDAVREADRHPMPRVDDLPASYQPRYTHPPLGAMQQQLLFHRYNYLKYKAAKRRDSLDRYEPRVADLDAIESHLKEANRIRDRLHDANRSVVLLAARRHLVGKPDPSVAHLLELLQRGEAILTEAIEAYGRSRSDFTRFLNYRLMRGFLAHTAERGERIEQ